MAAPPGGSGKEAATSATARRALLVAGIVIVLSLAAAGAYAWLAVGGGALTGSGYLALALGILGTIGLAVGLMALVFYSHRYGYDDRVGGGEPPQKGD